MRDSGHIAEILIGLTPDGGVTFRMKGNWPMAPFALAEKILSEQVTQMLRDSQSRIARPAASPIALPES